MCGGQRSTSVKISLSHEKDFEGERKETMLKVLGYCFQTFPWSFSRMLYVQHGEKLQCLVAKKSDAKKRVLEAENFFLRVSL